MNRSRICATAWICGLLAITACRTSPAGGAAEQISIYVGRDAPGLEQYAARELQRYLYQLSGSLPRLRAGVTAVDGPGFIIGRRKTNPLVEQLAAAGQVKVSDADPGPQGYVLKRLAIGDNEVVVIAGSDEPGCLYGVYGLLEEHYGIGFYLCGDVLPDRKAPLRLAHVDERKAPAAAIRGFLPWTNFPQSATVYSWEDWRFIIDQMAKMRMNFLHIHNYNETGLLPRVSPVPRHNEMFHNFTYRGTTSRVWMATVRTGHFWWGPPWDLAQYRFGAGDLFDDYDFGADCALHNEGLSNEEVFRKGVSEFQKILVHAHARGVKVGLGLDINVIPEDYKAKADDPGVVAARAEQIVRDYPDLDYLLCFQAENTGSESEKWSAWRRTVLGFYEKLKARSPATRLAVAGWGLNPASIARLPADVICAPISAYSDACDSGAAYGNREYWGCPWLERDSDSSEYYATYKVHLSNTIKAWQRRAANMKGFYCLTWRVADAVDPKISYVAKAPWDLAGKYASSRAMYREYAAINYGENVADRIAAIIDQNEPVASLFAECSPTWPFKDGAGAGELDKAVRQLAVVDGAIAAATSEGRKARLRLLRRRLAAEKDHIELDHHFERYQWDDLPGAMESWVHNFTYRVNDISSLGNVTSVENRFVQRNYVAREDALRRKFAVQPPSEVEARGTRTGAVITWRNMEPGAKGFHVYRDKTRLDAALLPVSQLRYEDRGDGEYRYTVAAVTSDGRESPRSVPSICQAGAADKTPPHIVMVSPPTLATEGQPVWVKIRVLANRTYESVSAAVYYRTPGVTAWKSLPMRRRVKAVFAAAIPAAEVGPAGMEYYVESSDGDNVARFPPDSPRMPLSLVSSPPSAGGRLLPPRNPRADEGAILWDPPAAGSVFWYRIYRGRQPNFPTGPDTLLTYVAKGAVRFTDNGFDLTGRKRAGAWYYRISALDKEGRESDPTPAVSIRLPPENPPRSRAYGERRQ